MKISVIIPAYNCAQYIVGALECIRHQSFPKSEIEIIVCVDGATDNTTDVVKKYAATYSDVNIVVIKSKTNHGVSYTRNYAAQHARGEYIHFMDADDIINTDFYGAMYDAARRTDSDAAVACYISEHNANNNVIFNREMVFYIMQDKLSATRVDLHGYTWRYLIRRNFWIKQKLKFPVDMQFCEDLPTMTRMVCATNHIVTVPGAEYLYKKRENSLVTNADVADIRRASYNSACAQVAEILKQNNLTPNVRRPAS